MSLSNQKWLSAPGTAYDFCFDQEVHKALLKLFHTAGVPLSAVSAESVPDAWTPACTWQGSGKREA